MKQSALQLIRDLNEQPSFMDALKAMCVEEANERVDMLRAAAKSGDTLRSASVSAEIDLLEEFTELIGRYAAQYRVDQR